MGEKVSEVKTFTVPITLEEIKENITSISSNASSKPEKEKIINIQTN